MLRRWLSILLGDLTHGYSYKPCGDCGEMTFNDLLCEHCQAYHDGEVILAQPPAPLMVENSLGQTVRDCCKDCDPTKGCHCKGCSGWFECVECACLDKPA